MKFTLYYCGAYFHLIFLSLLCFPHQNLFCQTSDDLLTKYPPETLNQANTADTCSYLTSEEKKVIQICNLARIDGKQFKEFILLNCPAIAEHTDNIRYVGSLLTDIEKVKNYPLLQPEHLNFILAKKHAEAMGLTGKVGHEGVDARFKKMKKKSGTYKCGENCDYGNDKALDIVLDLLIDDGVPSLGHRKSILDKNFNYIGVSIMPHKKYGYNCVQLFAAVGHAPQKSFWQKLLFWKD